jgi:CubicO group peptidase (beta-lactamase class C family)
MSRLGRRVATFLLIAVIGIASARAQMILPFAAAPEEVGLSSERLARLEAITEDHIKYGVLPGAVMLVARHGKIAWFKTLGYRDRDRGDAMRPDAIFRLYSMTKPIVTVAAMMLVEEGRMQITDPVEMYLPEIGKMKVGVEKPGPDGKPVLELVEPARKMTVQDLMRHTSGLIYGSRGNSLINDAYKAAKIGNRDVTTAEFVTRLSELPLRFSPGTRWEYSVSTDVLGRVVEVVSGKPLGEFVAERVFQPLGMTDTGFWVPAEKLNRAAQPWQQPGGPVMTPRFDVAVRPRFESAGGGLTGTMNDYLRFAVMLVNQGRLGEMQLLGKKTVEFMTSDHIGGVPGRPPGLGFGLGFEVRTTPGQAGLPGSVGEYGWAGNAGTLFWIDPKEDLIAIYLIQVSDSERVKLRNQFRTMVQSAIIE